jgi:Spy/CpxP family protein refolding chaperone
MRHGGGFREEFGGRRGGPRRMRGGRWGMAREQRTTPEQRQQIKAWFAGRLPDDWYTETPQVTVDTDEILIVGRLTDPSLESGTSDDDRRTAEAARISRFREDTRDERMRIAEEAQSSFGRHVSWGATAGGTTRRFTTASVPVMTRLGIDERQVLDTLIDAGVARSRSEALAWCVRLVGENEASWIADLREAFEQVERVRAQGPGAEAGVGGSGTEPKTPPA